MCTGNQNSFIFVSGLFFDYSCSPIGGSVSVSMKPQTWYAGDSGESMWSCQWHYCKLSDNRGSSLILCLFISSSTRAYRLCAYLSLPRSLFLSLFLYFLLPPSSLFTWASLYWTVGRPGTSVCVPWQSLPRSRCFRSGSSSSRSHSLLHITGSCCVCLLLLDVWLSVVYACLVRLHPMSSWWRGACVAHIQQHQLFFSIL